MPFSRGPVGALFVACLTAFSGPALAENAVISVSATLPVDDAEQRINQAGKLRMLSQRIPSAACHFIEGVATQDALDLLKSATEEFETILNALEYGDPALNIIDPETNRKILVRIADLRATWVPLKAATDAVIAGDNVEENIETIFLTNMDVLGSAVALVPQMVRRYSTPGATRYSMLMLVDISGRQRMLTQKMSKESCFAGTDYASDSTIDDLQGTMAIFETSLNALQVGLPEVGVLPPPNSAISSGLDIVKQDWSSVKGDLELVLNGDALGPDASGRKFHELNITMANMNSVVGLYADAAKPRQFH